MNTAIRTDMLPVAKRHLERRGYGDGGGIGIRAPGVSVEIGTDRY